MMRCNRIAALMTLAFVFFAIHTSRCNAQTLYYDCLQYCLYENEEVGEYLYVCDEYSSDTVCNSTTYQGTYYIWEDQLVPAPETCGNCSETFNPGMRTTGKSKAQVGNKTDQPMTKLPPDWKYFGRDVNNKPLGKNRYGRSWSDGIKLVSSTCVMVKSLKGDVPVRLFSAVLDRKKAGIPEKLWPTDVDDQPIQTSLLYVGFELESISGLDSPLPLLHADPLEITRTFAGTVKHDGVKYTVVTNAPLF